MTDSKNVYIVDDEEAVRHSLSTLLSVLGYLPASFASAEEFLESFQPDLTGFLFVDLRLTGLSGRELIEKVAAEGTELSIILMTGHAASDSLSWTAAHSVLVLEKPFSAADLKQHLASAGVDERQ